MGNCCFGKRKSVKRQDLIDAKKDLVPETVPTIVSPPTPTVVDHLKASTEEVVSPFSARHEEAAAASVKAAENVMKPVTNVVDVATTIPTEANHTNLQSETDSASSTISPVVVTTASSVAAIGAATTADVALELPKTTSSSSTSNKITHISTSSEVPASKGGFLLKQGATFKNMVSRYFFLEKGILSNYASEEDLHNQLKVSARSEKILNLKDAKVLTLPGKGQFIIENSSNKKHILEVEDKTQYDAWLKAIQEHVGFANNTSVRVAASIEPSVESIPETKQDIANA